MTETGEDLPAQAMEQEGPVLTKSNNMKSPAYKKFLSTKKVLTGIKEISEFLAAEEVYCEVKSVPIALHTYGPDEYWISEEKDSRFIMEIESQAYQGTLEELELILFMWTGRAYDTIQERDMLTEFLWHVMTDLSLDFHPDTPFENYKKADGSPAFTPTQAEIFDHDLMLAHQVCDAEAINFYVYVTSVKHDIWLEDFMKRWDAMSGTKEDMVDQATALSEELLGYCSSNDINSTKWLLDFAKSKG